MIMGGMDWDEFLIPTHKKMSEKRSMAITPAETSTTVLLLVFSISFFMILALRPKI